MAIALLANSIATGCALIALILTFGPISGSHMNPVVSLSAGMLGDLSRRESALYAVVQVAGALLGAMIANLMFDLPAVSAATNVRAGVGIWVGEFIATFGLIGIVIAVGSRGVVLLTALAVAGYVTAAYWFTSSTSFANPAVTIARTISDSFSGIRPADSPAFIGIQVVAALAATKVFDWLTQGGIVSEKKRVLILCTGNSARSQMAEGLLRNIAGDRFEVHSAGVDPTSVRPEAIAAMRELNIDISHHRSKSVDDFVDERFDYIITVCDNANELCPAFSGDAMRIHWSFADPAAVTGSEEERLRSFRNAREQIRTKLTDFAKK